MTNWGQIIAQSSGPTAAQRREPARRLRLPALGKERCRSRAPSRCAAASQDLRVSSTAVSPLEQVADTPPRARTACCPAPSTAGVVDQRIAAPAQVVRARSTTANLRARAALARTAVASTKRMQASRCVRPRSPWRGSAPPTGVPLRPWRRLKARHVAAAERLHHAGPGRRPSAGVASRCTSLSSRRVGVDRHPVGARRSRSRLRGRRRGRRRRRRRPAGCGRAARSRCGHGRRCASRGRRAMRVRLSRTGGRPVSRSCSRSAKRSVMPAM